MHPLLSSLTPDQFSTGTQAWLAAIGQVLGYLFTGILGAAGTLWAAWAIWGPRIKDIVKDLQAKGDLHEAQINAITNGEPVPTAPPASPVPAPPGQTAQTINKIVPVLVFLAVCLGASGCASISALVTPSNIAALKSVLGKLVYTETADAITEYAGTGKLNFPYMIADGIRTIEGTSNLVDATAVQSALEASGTPSQIALKLAPTIAATAKQLLDGGVSSVQAGEVSATNAASVATDPAIQ